MVPTVSKESIYDSCSFFHQPGAGVGQKSVGLLPERKSPLLSKEII